MAKVRAIVTAKRVTLKIVRPISEIKIQFFNWAERRITNQLYVYLLKTIAWDGVEWPMVKRVLILKDREKFGERERLGMIERQTKTLIKID